MWSKYDEMLLQNPFFMEIQEHHKDILEKSSRENWTICVPRMGTFELEDVTVEAILDHILIPEDEDNMYHTLSKKNIQVQNRHITKHSSHDSICDSIEILFEETFYVQKKSKYKVWCIECPLFWNHKNSHTQSIKIIGDLRDCLDFLWCESLGHTILDGIKNTVLNSAAESQTIEAEDLQTQKEFIGILFSQCLQVGMKNEIISDKVVDNLFFENFKLAVETYMQYCLGRKLIYSIGSACHQADSHLTKIIKNSNHLHYQDLGISCKFLNIITAAKSELSRINNYFTALEKINCLRKTFQIFQEGGSAIAHITSDHILPVLVFLILKLNINNWVANLLYLKEFRLSSLKNPDHISFVISSLEAAVEFIKSSEFLHLKKGLEQTTNCNNPKLKLIVDGIKSGQVNLFINHKSLMPEIPKQCHPLCLCTTCQEKEKEESSKNLDPLCHQSLLISATLSGDSEVVDFLLNQGVDPNETDSSGKTCVHYTVSRGHQSILLLLLNFSVNLNAIDNDGNSPLHLACLNGQENCVKALIYSSKINIDCCNALGETPLHLATICGYYEIVKILLENGASPFVKNKRNQAPLDVVPDYYIKEMFRKSISNHRVSPEEFRKVDKNDSISQPAPIEEKIENFRKIDLLLKAIESNDLPLTNFYLGFHSNSKIQKYDCCHPLCTCNNCKRNTEEHFFETDIESMNINICDMNGYTPLHVAAKFGRTEILRLLLDSGALVDVKTNNLHTPLHLACINNRTQIVKELLKCGDCKVDELDTEGNTSLFYACENNNMEIVKMLLLSGADCNIRNNAGKSAFQHCEENMQYRLMKILNSNMNSSIVDWDTSGSTDASDYI
ncbi:unnamed protein product [Phaedon cochleariae]|uniref:VPS9 domain-containing protein n=1 Tax=Phaedon cochleariae TaxID=80249 RepID=A0A9N9SCJ2_PHACE|nr:unnamed protein product [Phaedon cochleariae]